MREKMAIFIKGNSVCRGIKMFRAPILMHVSNILGYSYRNIQCRETMGKKMAIFEEGNSVCRGTFFSELPF